MVDENSANDPARGGSRDTLSLVQASFPGRETLIESAFYANSTFRLLCDDYHVCVTALDHWRRREGQGSPDRQREYAEMLADLGREIETWLEAMENASTSGQKGQ